MRQKFIKFVRTTEERNRIKTEFYKKLKIPGVLGCIDCTQVAIIRLIIHEERYYCRKQYHSLNVQIVSGDLLHLTLTYVQATSFYLKRNHAHAHSCAPAMTASRRSEAAPRPPVRHES
uniref:SFRICE_023707 n=1 Tax=Spodoptera frugiperda TaxID=7108 RepID=A0A2H1WEY3_SPOFR